MTDASATATADEDPPPLTSKHPAWQQFELDVAALAAQLDPNAEVKHNVKREGHVSGRERQVDVLITGRVGLSDDIEVAVECKRNTTDVLGIGVVDQFVGKLTDLGVDRGVLCAWGGFGAGATARAGNARNPKIQLRELRNRSAQPDWSELAEGFLFGGCPNPNCWGEVHWSDWPDGSGGIVSVSTCHSCGTLAAKCPECDSINAIDFGATDCFACDVRFDAHVTPGDAGVDSIDVIRPRPSEG